MKSWRRFNWTFVRRWRWADPFLAFGGGTCRNAGWFPPGMPLPPVVPPVAPVPGGCTTPDPFVAFGGGVCNNGGWRPRN